jgi:cephalosporin-C deacetylase
MIVNVPAGCDVSGPRIGRAAPYPHWDVSQPDIAKSVVYFDAVNFASRITAHALVAMGFIDETSPPAGVWAAFNQLRGPKEVVPMIDSPHNHMATPEQQLPYVRRSTEWLDTLVHGGDPLAATDRP